MNRLNNELIESTQFISDSKEKPNKKSLKHDAKTICLLIYLYLLQGIPLGLAASIPLILSARKVSFSEQGTFSFVFWPFSLKLLWAPIVDCLYFKKFGRRKTWLIPVQLVIGIFMLCSAQYSQNLVYNIQSKSGKFL